MATDTLEPDVVLPMLRSVFGRPYRYTECCPSTQDLLRADDPQGTVAVADEQLAGRGRLGRRWTAPPGAAILCSVVLRPPPGRVAAQTSLVGGIAAARTLSEAAARPTRVKWPNDVLLDRKKIAGVLAEARGNGIVLGFGLNVNQPVDAFPREERARATSLYGLDREIRARAPILATLLAELEDAYTAWVADGLAALADELSKRDALRGHQVTVGDVTGVADGIDTGGRLLVRGPGGHIAVESGEASVAGGTWQVEPTPSARARGEGAAASGRDDDG